MARGQVREGARIRESIIHEPVEQNAGRIASVTESQFFRIQCKQEEWFTGSAARKNQSSNGQRGQLRNTFLMLRIRAIEIV